MDGFPGFEPERDTGDQRCLVVETFQMHLDAAKLFIVEGHMREAVEVEGAVQLAVYAFQKVEIEGCGHAGRVVVGGFQPLTWIS